ncbi:MAG TPA: Bax inhibitor-1 family protein, partial [Polyangiaceae bacterium]|nr:Bax inhibitor-1 family protein [Polyangiaceae bacterium]
MIPGSEYSSGPLPWKAAGVDVAFLRKVYLLVTASVGVSAAAAAFALFAGASAGQVPPLVAWFGAHPIIALLLMFGATFGASAVARKPGLNVLALFGLAALMGLFIAPAVFVAQLVASQGQTLSPSPVLHAFALAVAAFVGLSG